MYRNVSFKLNILNLVDSNKWNQRLGKSSLLFWILVIVLQDQHCVQVSLCSYFYICSISDNLGNYTPYRLKNRLKVTKFWTWQACFDHFKFLTGFQPANNFTRFSWNPIKCLEIFTRFEWLCIKHTNQWFLYPLPLSVCFCTLASNFLP